MDKILVAMSGGVDSSAAALTLLSQGCRVAGATLELFPSENASAEARRVCEGLGIGHFSIDASKAFSGCVIAPFLRAYERGLTPNPCVLCNPAIKFGLLLDWALERGFCALATGHYARLEKENERVLLKRAADAKKDQSYFLYAIPQKALNRALFPLGEMKKEDVRALAQSAGLPCAQKGDSQDICFIRGERYDEFLRRSGAKEQPGDILDISGNVVGRHTGLLGYTIGQRKGIGAHAGVMYVVKKDYKTNTLVIGTNEALFTREVFIRSSVFAGGPEPFRAEVKLRSTHSACPCTVYPRENRIVTDEPQRAVTPGQSAVWYIGDTVAGGGIIAG